MLSLLKEKISNYSYELSKQYRDKIIPVDPNTITPTHPFSVWGMPEKPFGFTLWLIAFHNRPDHLYPIYEKIDEGYLIYTKNTGVLFGFDSKIYKLSKTHLDHDWSMHQELYHNARDSIQIEKPIHGEKIEFLNSTYWYTVVERPNMVNLVNPHQIHQENRLTEKYIIDFIEEVGKKVRVMKTVFDKHQKGCLGNGSPMHKFETNPNDSSIGIWVDIKHWNINFDMYLAHTYGSIYHYLDDHRNKELIKHEDIRPILNHTLSKLTGLGVSDNDIMMVETNIHNIEICDQTEKPKNIYV